MDLIIRNARLADAAPEQPPVDIGIDKGRIVAIERSISAAAKTYDAGGKLACAGLVETHIHIDKSRIIERCAPQPRRTLSPVTGVAVPRNLVSASLNCARATPTRWSNSDGGIRGIG